ncbi:MAG: hypothetical protein A4E28_00330 [Methanocella sp. PtaU1.Bin125]|nr:MAG: hypothetical protein A4E28_00330 [Methanocella sp. PtaU1.Bin125]
MPLLEPKVYQKNGLEAFRLVGSDGSELFYEGAIDCDESQLFKDPAGRLYYQVISRVGGPVRYYVELDPQVPRIPMADEEKTEKEIARLVNASPRESAALPDDIYVVPEAAPADEPAETTPEMVAESIFDRIHGKEPGSPEAESLPAQDEKPATATSPVPDETPVMKPEASEAIHAIFSPKVDNPHPGEAAPEKKPAQDRAAPPGATKKRRSLRWPAAIAIVIVLIAAVIAGVYVVRPATFDGLRSLYAQPTATPQPTPAPTAEPTPAPTPAPTPEPDQTAILNEMFELADADDPVVLAFAQAHTDASSAGDPVMQACDLFSFVNARWNDSENEVSQPRKASEIADSLEGTQKDYTVLMSALMQSIDVDSRVILSYSDDLLRYYPEVFVSNTSAGYSAAVQKLNNRYGTVSPQGHSDDTGYWISLSRGGVPGIRPGGATLEYALYNGEISPIKIS